MKWRRDSAELMTDVAVVPIRVGDGYRLNGLLKDIMTHRGNPVERHRMKKRHADVLRLIVDALEGPDMPPPLDDDGWRPGGESVEARWLPAGALVIFDSSAVAEVQGARETRAAPLKLPQRALCLTAPAEGRVDNFFRLPRSDQVAN